jgi:hypothetical protein
VTEQPHDDASRAEDLPQGEQPRPERAPDDTPRTRTGNAEVDSVLDSLDALEAAPLSEHVAVFEAAHEKLRGALADAGNDQQSS